MCKICKNKKSITPGGYCSIYCANSRLNNRKSIIEKLGYTPYIIKDMGSFNPSFVKSEFEKLDRSIT